MKPAPIVIFTYNRLWHTKQTVENLQKNELANESELFIFSDGAKPGNEEKVKEVREYLKTITGFKKLTIIERDKNWGLANNIIDGVTRVVNEYSKIIVLEDDIITSPYFLKFMNEGLEVYKDEGNVACISGYIYPINNLPDLFFIRGADCWGWATWDRAWKIFEKDGKKLLDEIKSRKLQKVIDFNGNYPYVKMLKKQIKGKNNSWAIRWYISAFLKDMLCLYPGKSYVLNIGFDKNASHTKGDGTVFNTILNDTYKFQKIEAFENLEARRMIEEYFKKVKPTIFRKIRSRIIRLIK